MATNPPPAITTQHTVDGVPTNAPTTKVTAGAAAGTVAGALTTILSYFVFKYAFPAGLDSDVQAAVLTLIGSAVTVLVSFGVGWLTPHSANEGIGQYVQVPLNPPVPASAAVVSVQPASTTVTAVQQPGQ